MKTTKLAMERPSKMVRTSAARAALRLSGDNSARLTIAISEEMHAAVKVRAAQQRLTIREYLLTLLEKDGVGRM
jgi:hypothetical protein